MSDAQFICLMLTMLVFYLGTIWLIDAHVKQILHEIRKHDRPDP